VSVRRTGCAEGPAGAAAGPASSRGRSAAGKAANGEDDNATALCCYRQGEVTLCWTATAALDKSPEVPASNTNTRIVQDRQLPGSCSPVNHMWSRRRARGTCSPVARAGSRKSEGARLSSASGVRAALVCNAQKGAGRQRAGWRRRRWEETSRRSPASNLPAAEARRQAGSKLAGQTAAGKTRCSPLCPRAAATAQGTDCK
jgi:hypothetical protein